MALRTFRQDPRRARLEKLEIAARRPITKKIETVKAADIQIEEPKTLKSIKKG